MEKIQNFRPRLSRLSPAVQRLGVFVIAKCAHEQEALAMERFLNKAAVDPNLLAHLSEETVSASASSVPATPSVAKAV